MKATEAVLTVEIIYEFNFVVERPWWWWLNPWLYATRLDRAYEDACGALHFYAQRSNQKGGAT